MATASPQINLGFRASWGRFSTKPRKLKIHNAKESSTVEPSAKQYEFSNGKVHVSSKSDHKYPSLVDAIKVAAEENVASFHFPGHNRGRAAPSSLTELIGQRPFLHDLPELPELGNIFPPEGPILEAQKMAAEVFGASETWFLVGGTTSGIQAAIMGTCCPGDTLILPRNSHISAISAMVLSGVVPKYIFPDYDSDWDIATAVTPLEVEKAIRELELECRKPAAVFITSPTYHGICSNLKEISSLCHLHDIPLIVDEAHGAHFGFHPHLPISALQQGADISVQSTHKVLCSLTQSSMLHVSGKIVDRDNISRCLQTIQTTSPSYLLLASLDAATFQLRENPWKLFDNPIHLAMKAKNTIKQIPGISVLDFPIIDPLRVTVGFHDLGLSGYEADDFLFKNQTIIPELVGSRSITLPFTPGTCGEHVERLVLGLEHLSLSFLQHTRTQKRGKCADLKAFDDIDIQLNPREAFFTKKRTVGVKDSIGKVCGELICPYPPGIPILIPGEVISQRGIDVLLELKAYGAVINGATDPLFSSMVICDI